MVFPPKNVRAALEVFLPFCLGLGTGTVCTGSSNLLVEPASRCGQCIGYCVRLRTRRCITETHQNAFRKGRGEEREEGVLCFLVLLFVLLVRADYPTQG